LLALLVQCAAAALPMPAAAGATGLPGWLESSLCQGSGPEAPAHAPATPTHLICPVCFVLSAAGSAVPPQPPAFAEPRPQPLASPAIPDAQTTPRQHAGSLILSRAPPLV
jgi:hypothetical protein